MQRPDQFVQGRDRGGGSPKARFSCIFERVQAKRPREVLSRSLRFLSAQGSSCLLAEPEDSDRNASCLLGDFGDFLQGAFSSRREFDWGLMAIL